MKKNTTKKILLGSVIFIILCIVGFLLYYFVLKDSSLLSSLTDTGISIFGVYDADGNLITSQTQATVGGVSGVKFITLRVNAINKDTVPLSFKIVNATPMKFQNALSSSTNTAQPDSVASWISDLIDIQEYTGTQQKFSVTIEASSPSRQSMTKSYSATVNIDQDPVSEFDVDIVETAGEDPVFGEAPECTLDSECESNEECIDQTCVLKAVETKVLFRTTDLAYGSSSAIAYANYGCGLPLNTYGRTSGACTTHYCDDPSSATLKVTPASYIWIVDSSTACVCEKASIGVHTYAKKYTSSDSDASTVSTNLDSINPSMEITCTP